MLVLAKKIEQLNKISWIPDLQVSNSVTSPINNNNVQNDIITIVNQPATVAGSLVEQLRSEEENQSNSGFEYR